MRSKKLLDEFVAYCEACPDLRFWQALANWILPYGWHNVLVSQDLYDPETKQPIPTKPVDTWHWEDNWYAPGSLKEKIEQDLGVYASGKASSL